MKLGRSATPNGRKYHLQFVWLYIFATLLTTSIFFPIVQQYALGQDDVTPPHEDTPPEETPEEMPPDEETPPEAPDGEESGLVRIQGTSVSLDPIQDVVQGARFTVSGKLVSEGVGISEKSITFSVDHPEVILPDATTAGIIFEHPDVDGIRMHPHPNTPDDDEHERVGPPGTNNILHLKPDATITFPPNTSGVVLQLQGMGTNTVKVSVTKGDDSTFNAESRGLEPDFAVFSILSSDGIKSIRVTEVAGGSTDFMEISSLMTFDLEGNPQLQHKIDFESESSGNKGPRYAVNDGLFFSTGAIPLTLAPDTVINVRATFPGEGNLIASTSLPMSFSTLGSTVNSTLFGTSLAGAAGEATTGVTNYIGTEYATSASCAADDDQDGLCDDWENNGGIPYSDYNGVQVRYPLCIADAFATVWGLPAGTEICARSGHKDVFVELDYMHFHSPTTQTEAIPDVIKAFGNSPVTNTANDAFGRPGGITLHVVQSDEVGPDVSNLNAWRDPGSSVPHDTDDTNDFASIKHHFFGQAQDRTAKFSTDMNVDGPSASDILGTPVGGPLDETFTDGDGITFKKSDIRLDITDGTAGKVIITTTAIFNTSPGTVTVQDVVSPSGYGADFTDVSWTASVTSPSGTTRTIVVKISFKTVGDTPITNALLSSEVQIRIGSSGSSGTLTGNKLTSPDLYISTNRLDVVAWAYRYGLYAHSYAGPCGPSGLAETPGNDFIVSLGCNFGANPDPSHTGSIGTREEQAGTLMHELGHTLGLFHGAPAKENGVNTPSSDYNANCKPNYPSVMTYTRQFPAYWGRGGEATWRSEGLDYSREELATLVEGTATNPTLNEPAGLMINQSPSQTFIFATPRVGAGTWDKDTAGDNIDWYNDNQYTMTYENINNFGNSVGCTGYGTTLNSFEDWSNLQLNFRPSTGFYDGVYANPLMLPQEITPEIYKAILDQAEAGETPPPTTTQLPRPWWEIYWWVWIIIAIIIIIIIVYARRR